MLTSLFSLFHVTGECYVFLHRGCATLSGVWIFGSLLRRLERVFRCCSVCETMEDYKEGYLIVWRNYKSPCSSIVGLYFKSTCEVISVTMATNKVHKGVL